MQQLPPSEMQQPPTFENSLRDQLIAAQDVVHARDTHPSMSFPDLPTDSYPSLQSSSDQPILDPQMVDDRPPREEIENALARMDAATSTAFTSPDRNKKPLAKTKRAAQNRAAQRAFRQRKEREFANLEAQVKRYQELEANFKFIEQENFQMRSYIVVLQNKLSEFTDDIPEPPAMPEPEFVDESNQTPGEVEQMTLVQPDQQQVIDVQPYQVLQYDPQTQVTQLQDALPSPNDGAAQALNRLGESLAANPGQYVNRQEADRPSENTGPVAGEQAQDG